MAGMAGKEAGASRRRGQQKVFRRSPRSLQSNPRCAPADCCPIPPFPSAIAHSLAGSTVHLCPIGQPAIPPNRFRRPADVQGGAFAKTQDDNNNQRPPFLTRWPPFHHPSNFQLPAHSFQLSSRPIARRCHILNLPLPPRRRLNAAP